MVAFNSYDAALSIGDAQQARTTAQETKSKASSAERIMYDEFMCSFLPYCHGVHLIPVPLIVSPSPRSPRSLASVSI